MKKIFFLTLLSAAFSVLCDEPPHIGYVYPAGGVPGTTFKAVVGGQYLRDTFAVHVSGGGVSAKIIDYTYELDSKAGNQIKNSMEKMKAMLDTETDTTVRQQLQYQMKQAEDQMMMVQMSRKERRKNPEMYAKKQFNPQLADTLTLEVTIDPDVEPGMHELCLVATNGLSNPLLFQISTLQEVFEKEPNDIPHNIAQSAAKLPFLLNGQIMPGDVDCFRFYAEQGSDLVCRVQARSLVPYLADAVPGWFQAVLTLYDATGNEIAYVDDFRFDPDPVLICQVPQDGEYVLEIRDSIYRGRRDFVYRIEVGELPFIDHIFPLGGQENRTVPVQLYGVNLPEEQIEVQTYGDAPEIRHVSVSANGRMSNQRPFAVDTDSSIGEAEPNNLAAQAQTLSGRVKVIDGRIDSPGDADYFQFNGYEGNVVEIEVQARRLDSPLDARITLLDPQEHILDIKDDNVDRSAGLVTHHADAFCLYTLPVSGTYTVRLDDVQGKGGPEYAYRLRVGAEQPDYHLRAVPSHLTIPENGNAVVTVYALRKAGFNGEIQLHVEKNYDGIELESAVIPEGHDRAELTISSSGKTKDDLITLEIEGKARVKGRTVRRPAVPAEDRMQAFLWRHLVTTKELLVRIADPAPASIHLSLPSSGFTEIVPGREFGIIATVTPASELKTKYAKIQLSNPPEWIKLISKGLNLQTEGNQRVRFRVDDNAPPGAFANLTLTGLITMTKPKEDPTYNPILKWKNRIQYKLVLGTVPVKVKDD